MYFLDDLEHLENILREDGWIWLPTDTGWCACCMKPLDLPFAEDRRLSKVLDQWTCLVSDIAMFKTLVPDLHPRIDTLLSLHRQPLSLYFKKAQVQVIRLATHPMVRQLIQNIGEPLWAYRLYEGDRPILKFEELPSDLLAAAAYVSKDLSKTDFELPVLAEYNHKANLKFIRE